MHVETIRSVYRRRDELEKKQNKSKEDDEELSDCQLCICQFEYFASDEQIDQVKRGYNGNKNYS